MKLATKLSLIFTLLTAAILFIFALAIHIIAENNREEQFYDRLRIKIHTRTELLLDASVDERLVRALHSHNKKTLNEAEVDIYDGQFKSIYHDTLYADTMFRSYLIGKKQLQRVKANGELRWAGKEWQAMGVKYNVAGKQYLVFGVAHDYLGHEKVHSLDSSLIRMYLCSILLIFLSGYVFSYYAISPINRIIARIKNINASSLDSRLEIKNKKDELSELSRVLNQILTRLEDSFNNQKKFVSNISHEVRTPLSAIIAELELARETGKRPQELIAAIDASLEDAYQLSNLSMALMDFARASYDATQISWQIVRVDELLMETSLGLQRKNVSFGVDILFANDFDLEQEVSIQGNLYLLEIAFANLMDNACKYSPDHRCRVKISFTAGFLQLEFIDEGIGIDKDELGEIFKMFYRGKNSNFNKGNGVGLPLVQKIIELHKGSLSVVSRKHEGTTVIVNLPGNL